MGLLGFGTDVDARLAEPFRRRSVEHQPPRRPRRRQLNRFDTHRIRDRRQPQPPLLVGDKHMRGIPQPGHNRNRPLNSPCVKAP